MIGSVAVVLTGFQTITGLHTLETTQGIEAALKDAPGSGLGLDVAGVQQLIRVGAMVASGCATAAAILGYQVLKRQRSARVVLTVLTVPLFLGGLAVGGFFTSLVAVAIATLWLYPARAWFNGTWRPDAEKAERSADAPPTQTPPARPPTQTPPDAPPALPPTQAAPTPDRQPMTPAARPVAGFGAPVVTAPPPAPVPGSVPYPVPPGAPAAGLGAPRRPAALIWAAVLTWVFASLGLLSTLAAVAVLLIDPSPVLTELHRQQPELAAQGVTDRLIVDATYAMAAVMSLWAIASIVLAGLVFLGIGWARVTLAVLTALSATLLVLGVAAGQLVLLVPLAAAVATVVLLGRGEVRGWCAARRTGAA